MPRTFSRDGARAFYDRFGARQDRQGWYEDAVLADLVSHLRLDRARRVFEFGCGTGKLAERLLTQVLPADAEYAGIDLSGTMRTLASERLRPFGERAVVCAPESIPPGLVQAGRYDRYLSTYVFDLLSETEIAAQLAEAQRLLAPGGLLGLAGLTEGESAWGRFTMRVWRTAHAIHPALVGGCRPLRAKNFLAPDAWVLQYRGLHSAWGIHSEAIVAASLP